MSLFGILRFSSLLWLRRRTSCSASVPVTGSSVNIEFHRRQLDLVTGIAALLAVDMRERTPFVHAPLDSLQDRTKIWPPSGSHCPEASRTRHPSRHLGQTASRRALSHRHVPQTAAGAPPATEVEVPRSYVSVPAASGIPAYPRTFACTRPHLPGSAGFPGEYAAAAVQERELPLAPVGLAVVRLLIDANLSPKVTRALGKSGLAAVHVGDVGLLTASDRCILDYAAANDLVIVSADSDRGEMLAASRGATRRSVVLLRSADRLTSDEQAALPATNPASRSKRPRIGCDRNDRARADACAAAADRSRRLNLPCK